MDGVSKTQVSPAVSSVVGEKDKRAPKKKCVGSDVTSVSRNLIITFKNGLEFFSVKKGFLGGLLGGNCTFSKFFVLWYGTN